MSFVHELWYIWINYFWASLKGNGPEALVQTVVYAGVAYLFYPPFRAWVKREGNRLHDKLDSLHAKVDHGHKHLGVPSYVEPEQGDDVHPVR